MIIDRPAAESAVAHWEEEPALARSEVPQTGVTLEERQARFGQRPCTILLTGYSGAGKTSTAQALERELFAQGRAAMVLDGQQLRSGLSRGLGFSAEERSENLRRGVEVARLVNEAGLICICAFVAPSEDVRRKAASVIGPDRFVMVHLDAPLEVCRARDQEGLYGAAERGEIANFPGVSFGYEAPTQPDLVLATHSMSVADCVDRIVQFLRAGAFID
jgi:bifunctional enzyme CysN/CysC